MRWVGLIAASLAVACSSEPLPPGPAPVPAATPAPTETGAPTAAPTSSAPPASGGSPGFAAVAEYPAGPYGRGVGAVIENLDFMGWRDPVAANYDPEALERISLGEFYDPTGQHTQLIVVNASAVWCTVCQAELRQMKTDQIHQRYSERGVQIFGTLFEDVNGGPARPSDLKLWGSAPARAIEFPLVLDPALKMGVYFTSDATPLNLVIDARSMRIVYALMGYDSTPGTGLWGVVDRELAKRVGSAQ